MYVENHIKYPLGSIDMIEELERMANLKIPKDLATEEATKYLIDACAKYDIMVILIFTMS